MKKYTYYIVTRSRDHHYPVLMANNGKAMLNEPCKRAVKIERTIERIADAVRLGDIAVVRITEKEFRKRYPRFAPNKGGRKSHKPKPTTK